MKAGTNKMNNENSNSQKTLKVSCLTEISENYSGIVEWLDDGTKEWWLDGKRHRTEGPAIEYPDGSKSWWVNGKKHRTDGPAIECADGSKCWYLNGKRHRTDGPAVECADGYKEWWVNGVRVNQP